MREGRNEFRELVKSLPYMGDSTDLIREDREHATIDAFTNSVDASVAISD